MRSLVNTSNHNLVFLQLEILMQEVPVVSEETRAHVPGDRKRTLAMFLCLIALLTAGMATAQEKIDLDAANRIRDTALNHSQIMEMVGYLTDVTGPRLTGSPNLKRAEEYARDKLREWGLENAHLEAWGPFGRGWSLEGFTANVISPRFSPLIAYPKAWSPGTDGVVRGEVVLLDVKTVDDFDKYKGQLKGKIILFSQARHVDPLFDPPAHRQTDEELLRLANAQPPGEPRPFQFTPEQRSAEELNYRKWRLIQDEGAAVVMQPSYRDAGTVYVTSVTVPYSPDVPFEKRAHAWDLSKPVVTPQVNVAAEQYNRIVRLVMRGIPVQLEVNIGVRFSDEDPMSYNVIAEIPGTDLKDEVVMVGGSIDSWHSGSGATDNAAGAATALEVIRILQALKLKPRRTIRIGLWSAEEQGTLGSHAYVAARPIFRDLLEPYKDLGASTLSIAGIAATDHVPFDEVGLPAFQWIRDYMEGDNTRAPHTNMDTYDHVLEDDLKQSAAVAASLIYHLAIRNERVPRKPLSSH